jgi:hypothetical protein
VSFEADVKFVFESEETGAVNINIDVSVLFSFFRYINNKLYFPVLLSFTIIATFVESLLTPVLSPINSKLVVFTLMLNPDAPNVFFVVSVVLPVVEVVGVVVSFLQDANVKTERIATPKTLKIFFFI